MSGTSAGSCPADGPFTANTPLAPLLPLPLPLRKSRNVAPAAAATSSGSGSGSSFFFLVGKRNRFFHPISTSPLFSVFRTPAPLLSPLNLSTPADDELKRDPSAWGTMRSSSFVIAVSSSLASNGFTIWASARTRRASSGLKGSSLPTVSSTGICAVSSASLIRWQTSSPL